MSYSGSFKKDNSFGAKFRQLKDNINQLNYPLRKQYNEDMKRLMCSGIEEKEANKIQQGVKIENAMAVFAKVWIPLRFVFLYRRGAFKDVPTKAEFVWVARTVDVFDKHLGQTDLQKREADKKQMDNYLTQKVSFKTKRDANQINISSGKWNTNM